MFHNIDVLKNYEKFVEKHLFQILFPEAPAYNFINKEPPAWGFSCEFFVIFANTLYPKTT